MYAAMGVIQGFATDSSNCLGVCGDTGAENEARCCKDVGGASV